MQFDLHIRLFLPKRLLARSLVGLEERLSSGSGLLAAAPSLVARGLGAESRRGLSLLRHCRAGGDCSTGGCLDVFTNPLGSGGSQHRPCFSEEGYGKAVVCFVTAHILEQGRKATLLTESRNVALLKTAESVGFYRSDEGGREK